jgi:hypothetical protein
VPGSGGSKKDERRIGQSPRGRLFEVYPLRGNTVYTRPMNLWNSAM